MYIQHHSREDKTTTIFFTSIAFFVLTSLSLLGYFFADALPGTLPKDTFLWFSFAFVSGLMTTFLPCTLPLAFITIPVVKEKRTLRSLGMILLFGFGVFLMLSFYGGVLGTLGAAGISLFPVEIAGSIIHSIYFFVGVFAYVLALGELGLIAFRMPSYTGVVPPFIRGRQGQGKMFFLGIFLGNIGVGCPFPAMPLLIASAVLAGSAPYGALLFFIHAIGRILPLIILLGLSTVGINGLEWLLSKKQAFDRGSGWVFIVLTSILITLGSYSHQWLYGSRLYAFATPFFQSIAPSFLIHTNPPHTLGIFSGGESNVVLLLVFLLLLPLWWQYAKERKRVYGSPIHEMQRLERDVERLHEELRGHEATLHLSEKRQHARVRELDHRIETLLTKRHILEEGARYNNASRLRSVDVEEIEEEALALRRNWYISLSILIIATVLLLV